MKYWSHDVVIGSHDDGPFVILTKNFIDIVYRLWISAKCVVLLGILVVWFYFSGPWPIIQYFQAFYLYNLSRFTYIKYIVCFSILYCNK
jgi:hypothetical protein